MVVYRDKPILVKAVTIANPDSGPSSEGHRWISRVETEVCSGYLDERATTRSKYPILQSGAGTVITTTPVGRYIGVTEMRGILTLVLAPYP